MNIFFDILHRGIVVSTHYRSAPELSNLYHMESEPDAMPGQWPYMMEKRYLKEAECVKEPGSAKATECVKGLGSAKTTECAKELGSVKMPECVKEPERMNIAEYLTEQVCMSKMEFLMASL